VYGVHYSARQQTGAEQVDAQLKHLILSIFEDHRDGGIDCETCSQKLASLAELVANGAKLHELLPAVEEHLQCCAECNEEYQALLSIIIAENSGLIQSSIQED
jgi:hypothetical protein